MTSFYKLSTADLLELLEKKLREFGEPIRRDHAINNIKTFNRACYAIMEEFDEFPLTVRDMARLWRLFGKVYRIQRPMSGAEFVVKPFERLGMPLSDGFLDEIELIKQCLYGILLKLHEIRMLAMSMTKLSNANYAATDALKKDVTEYFNYIRTTAPYSLCPWCKGIDWYQQQCDACNHSGWVGRDKHDAAPEQLRLEKTVFYDGRVLDIPTALKRRQSELAKTNPA